jgi:hypothetical protein
MIVNVSEEMPSPYGYVWMTINIYRAILAFLVFLSLTVLGDGVVLQGITRLTHGVR